MNISRFSNSNPANRKKLMEELEFLHFLDKLYSDLVTKNGKSKNSRISDFLEVIEDAYAWQEYKIEDYIQALFDHVFWQSSEHYRTSMEKFVVAEVDASEFVGLILYDILNDRGRAEDLEKDFKKQFILNLDAEHYQFGTIISDLVLVLEGYDDNEEIRYVTEEELRDVVKTVLSLIQKYFN